MAGKRFPGRPWVCRDRPIVPGGLAQPAWAVRHIAEEK